MTTPRLERLATLVAGDPTVAAVVADRHDGLAALDVRGPVALRPFLTSALAGRGTVLVVTATGREADELVSDLGELVDPEAVVAFPAWETLPHERLSPRSDTVGRRLAVLRRLVHPEDGGTPVRVVVAPVRSVLQPQVKGLADLVPAPDVAHNPVRILRAHCHGHLRAKGRQFPWPFPQNRIGRQHIVQRRELVGAARTQE